MYCQNCGDLFLGGYCVPGGEEDGSFYLVPDQPDIDRLPDTLATEKTLHNYGCYWPITDYKPIDLEWEARNPRSQAGTGRPNSYTFRFERVNLSPRLGAITTHGSPTGWLFTGTPDVVVDDEWRYSPPPQPTRCPRCGTDWERWKNARRINDRQRMASPIRWQATGHPLVTQILSDSLSRSLDPDRRRFVVFSDSRRDAATTSSNIANRQYQHVVRQLVVSRALDRGLEPYLDDLIRYLDGARDDAASDAFERINAAVPDTVSRAAMAALGGDRNKALSHLEALRGRVPDIGSITDRVADDLLAIGLNPAGPWPSKQTMPGRSDTRWISLVDWSIDPPRWRPFELGSAERRYQQNLVDELYAQVCQSLAAGRGNDYESMGLRFLASPEANAHMSARQSDSRVDIEPFVSSCIRTYLLARRVELLFAEMRGSDNPPPALVEYVERVAERHSLDADGLLDDVIEALEDSGAVREHLLRPRVLEVNEPAGLWLCHRCRTVHLHPSAGVCVDCGANLPCGPREGPRRPKLLP